MAISIIIRDFASPSGKEKPFSSSFSNVLVNYLGVRLSERMEIATRNGIVIELYSLKEQTIMFGVISSMKSKTTNNILLLPLSLYYLNHLHFLLNKFVIVRSNV